MPVAVYLCFVESNPGFESALQLMEPYPLRGDQREQTGCDSADAGEAAELRLGHPVCSLPGGGTSLQAKQAWLGRGGGAYLCAARCGRSYCSCFWCDRGRGGSAGLWGCLQAHCCCDLPPHGWRSCSCHETKSGRWQLSETRIKSFAVHLQCGPSTSPSVDSAASAASFLLAAGEKGAVLALEELFATVAVPVVAAQALHVPRTELAEFTSENAVQSAVSHQRAAGCQARRHVHAGGELVMTELHAHVCWLQIRRICRSQNQRREDGRIWLHDCPHMMYLKRSKHKHANSSQMVPWQNANG